MGAASTNAWEHVVHGECGGKNEEKDDQGDPDFPFALAQLAT